MTDQPTKWLRFRAIKPVQTAILFCGANSAEFDGPDREANARKFVDVDELVEAVKVLAADSRWVSGDPNFERVRTILAKMEG